MESDRHGAIHFCPGDLRHVLGVEDEEVSRPLGARRHHDGQQHSCGRSGGCSPNTFHHSGFQLWKYRLTVVFVYPIGGLDKQGLWGVGVRLLPHPGLLGLHIQLADLRTAKECFQEEDSHAFPVDGVLVNVPCLGWNGWGPSRKRTCNSFLRTSCSWSEGTQTLQRKNALKWSLNDNISRSCQKSTCPPWLSELNLSDVLAPWRGPEKSTSGSSQMVPSACIVAVAVVYGRLTRFFPCSSFTEPAMRWRPMTTNDNRGREALPVSRGAKQGTDLVDVQGNHISADLRLWRHHGRLLHLLPVGSQVGQPEVVVNKLETANTMNSDICRRRTDAESRVMHLYIKV